MEDSQVVWWTRCRKVSSKLKPCSSSLNTSGINAFPTLLLMLSLENTPLLSMPPVIEVGTIPTPWWSVNLRRIRVRRTLPYPGLSRRSPLVVVCASLCVLDWCITVARLAESAQQTQNGTDVARPSPPNRVGLGRFRQSRSPNSTSSMTKTGRARRHAALSSRQSLLTWTCKHMRHEVRSTHALKCPPNSSERNGGALPLGQPALLAWTITGRRLPTLILLPPLTTLLPSYLASLLLPLSHSSPAMT